jgi:predicted transcriptional regulator
MALGSIVSRVSELAKSNAILTGVGVAGTISTAVLSGRASFKAARTIINAETDYHIHLEKNGLSRSGIDRREKVAMVWKYYIPPVGVGVITVSAIVLANRIAGKEAAALAAAYTVSEKALTDYREQVIKKLGEKKDEEIRDLVAEARMSKNPINSREIILAGTDEVLCFDILSGRYFQSSKERIKAAENSVNFNIVNYMHASLSEFYDEIGLPATGFSDTMGFNANRRCAVRFSTQMSNDGRPCLAIDFIEDPVLGYHKLWD